MKEFKTHLLPSGLTAHLLPYDGPSTIAFLQIGAGKLDDPENLTGAAHVIEHMLAAQDEPEHGFLGKRWQPEDRIMNWGASTGYTHTTYRFLCELGHEDGLFRHVRGRVYGAENLRNLDYHLQCVLNERGHRGSDDSVTQLLGELFSHPRLDTSTSLPDMTTLMTFSLKGVREHHRNLYTFGNSHLILASPRPWEQLEPLIGKSFESEGERSGGLPPKREAAVPIRQDNPMVIRCRPNKGTVRLQMIAAIPLRLPHGLIVFAKHLIRTRLLDGLRTVFRVSYGPHVSVEHHGVANLISITVKAPSAMAPTLRDGMTGPFDDTSWVIDYLEPVREEIFAALNFGPRPSVETRLRNFSAMLLMHDRPPTHAELLTQIGTIGEKEVQVFLSDLSRVGFHMALD